MDLSLTEEQEMLRKFARDYFSDKLPKKKLREIEESETGYSPEIWKEMVDLGWTGLPFPEKYGGAGLSFLDLAVFLEEMGKACLINPFYASVIMAGYLILDAGTEDQKEKYLKAISTGKRLATVAILEKEGDYHPTAVNTIAKKNGNAWEINGSKLFVPDGNVADLIICLARTDIKNEKSLSYFAIEADDNGIIRTDLKTMSGRLSAITLNSVKVPGDRLLGEINKGWEITENLLNRAALAGCCIMVGMAQQVLDMTVAYAKDRKQFNRPIGSFQVIQHYCADMFTAVEAMRLAAFRAAWRRIDNTDGRTEIAQALMLSVELGENILALSHQIHAAIGVTLEYDLHFYTRAFKALQLSCGSQLNYIDTIADSIKS